MIHYSCDLCKRDLDGARDVRYLVAIDVAVAFDSPGDDETDGDRDHLAEIHEVLSRGSSDPLDDLEEGIAQELRFDLCPDCAKRFLKNPLGRELAFDFSKN